MGDVLPLFTGASGDVIVGPYGARAYTETAWIENMTAFICESVGRIAIRKHQLFVQKIAPVKIMPGCCKS